MNPAELLNTDEYAQKLLGSHIPARFAYTAWTRRHASYRLRLTSRETGL